ncbi:hypothetical protein LQW54_006006 [Pestalotiopsis sp. IQ-011]
MARAGSPHLTIRRRRHGSPHPIAMGEDELDPAERIVALEGSEQGKSEGPQLVQEDIPEHLGMAPAIFVPATFDYTKPRHSSNEERRDSNPTEVDALASTARVDRVLAELEDHIQAVKRNMSTIVLEQARKAHQEAAAQETSLASAGLPPPRSKRLPPTVQEREAMLWNMEAEYVPGRPYDVPASFGPEHLPETAPHPKDTPREALVTQIMNQMNYGPSNLDGYERSCANSRRKVASQVKQDIAQEVAKSLAQNEGDAAGKKAATAIMGGGFLVDEPMDIDE